MTLKLELALVPGFFIKALAVPFMLGAAKYAPGDWANYLKDPIKRKEFADARMHSACRHLADFLDGTMYDEDGQHNLAAAAWNCLVVLFYMHGGVADNLYNDTYIARLNEYKQRKEQQNDSNTQPAA